MFEAALIVFTVIVVALLWTTFSVHSREQDNHKGEFHHYVTSGKYRRELRKKRRAVLKVQEKRKKKRR